MDFMSTVFKTTAIAGPTAGLGALNPGTIGIIMGYRASQAEAAGLEASASMEERAARVEELKGKQEANAIRDRLIRTLAQNNAAAGGSGIDISSGTIQTGIRENIGQGERELSVSRFDAGVAAAERRNRALLLRNEAKGVKLAGKARAATQLFEMDSKAASLGAA